MNKHLFILFLILTSKCFCFDTDGILVSFRNDTIYRQLHIEDKDFNNYLVSNNMISKLRYKDAEGRLQKINAKNIKYLSFHHNNQDYKFYSINITENDWDESSTVSPEFYRLLNKITNKVKLYEFYDISDVAGAAVLGVIVTKSNYRSYLIQIDKRYVVVTPAGFRSNMNDLFKSNPELISKIKNGVYGYDDLPLIVSEYNNWYSTK
ncbi:MAG: hypothetical protein JWN78_1307 [Bacteroidota bacterium]|nr:hypothetical protein [Bacteroidota bacterium]